MTAPFQPGDRVLIDADGTWAGKLLRGRPGIVRWVYPPDIAAEIGYDLAVDIDPNATVDNDREPRFWAALAFVAADVVPDPRSPGSGVDANLPTPAQPNYYVEAHTSGAVA